MSIFEGLPPEELARVVESLECRVYEPGQTVVAEGDRTKEVFIAQSGSANVVIAGEDGVDRLVGRIVPGGTVGEISLLTGQPAVATVRAGADFEAIVLTEGDFARLADSFPQVYRNLGTILASRGIHVSGRCSSSCPRARTRISSIWRRPRASGRGVPGAR
jgi:CRP-like cAMP-binding protein